MSELTTLLRRGIRLPPAGWMLAAILAFYVLAGLFGRDPWKGEDAIHIGAAWHMLHFNDWLFLSKGGLTMPWLMPVDGAWLWDVPVWRTVDGVGDVAG